MGLDDFDGDDVWRFEEDTDERLVNLIDKHLPEAWRQGYDQKRQVYKTVEEYLRTPKHIENREKEAREIVSREEDVTPNTIRDAYGRRLYSRNPYVEKFQDALKKIEKEYSR